MAIVKFFEKFLLLIVQRRKKVVVVICYVPHQLLRFLIVTSAIGIGADITVEQLFKNRSHL